MSGSWKGVVIYDHRLSFWRHNADCDGENPYDNCLVWNSSESPAVKITGRAELVHHQLASTLIELKTVLWCSGLLSFPFLRLLSLSGLPFRDMDQTRGFCLLSPVKIDYRQQVGDYSAICSPSSGCKIQGRRRSEFSPPIAWFFSCKYFDCNTCFRKCRSTQVKP